MAETTSLFAAGEFKTDFRIGDGKDDARITRLVTEVTAICEGIAKRPLLRPAAAETQLINGDAREVLRVKRWPIESVTSVHVSTAVPRVYGADELLTVDTEYLIEKEKGFIHRIDGGVFPRGIQTVKVIYLGGYDPIPDDLARAAKTIASVILQKSKDKLYHLSREDRGEGQVTLLKWEDVPETAREILDGYNAGGR